MSRRLPVIDVPRPCPESWDSMSGIGPARDCAACGRKVHDLAAMTSAEVDRMLAARDERVCARIVRDLDGSIVTADRPAWQTGQQLRARLAGAAIAAVLTALRPDAVVIAQAGSSSPAIVGTITTQIHEALPGASVLAVNEATGEEYRAESGPDGRYRLLVPAGRYTVGVTADIFESQGKPHVDVAARADATFDAELRLPVVGETIVVYRLPADDGGGATRSFVRIITAPFRALAGLFR